MSTWDFINFVITTTLSVMVVYQILYIVIGLFVTKKYKETDNFHTYGFIIAGRNEEKVIGQLIESIKKQNYDVSKFKIFVCADNCTDKTAEIARKMGAIVYERHNLEKIGKSYALDFLFKNISRDYPDYKPDGYFIFDADNLLDKNFVREMNKAFDSGEEIVTSYRASKNYDASLMSMGSSIAFIRECRFMHAPRNFLKLSTHVSGTGFLVSSKILDITKGWNYGSLTEDLEFSCDNLMKGHRVAYCDSAVFYDEQPTTWKQTYKQRMRWQKGSYQCCGAFCGRLLLQFLTKLNFSFYDFFMFFFPLPAISTGWALARGLGAVITAFVNLLEGMAFGSVILALAFSLIKTFIYLYLGMFAYGSFAVVRDWKRINAKPWKKILSMFAYPLFMISLIPITFTAMFKTVKWEPIHHTTTTNIDELTAKTQKRSK